jgi:organic hydroperoxide reductase OsmC/OhrA
MAAKAKTLRYAAAVDRAGRISAEGRGPVQLGGEWSAEALVLAGLVRCILTSLAYHARRAELDSVGSGSAAGMITRRDEDGRYAFVQIDCELEVELEPEPGEDELAALLAKAERDCFISASLRVPPSYGWTVNGITRTAAR